MIFQPDVELPVFSDVSLICAGSPATITVSGTEPEVNYQLYANGIQEQGQQFIGNKSDQAFHLTPAVSTIYSIIATPTQKNSDGINCDSVQLSTVIEIGVEGPISVIENPIDQVLCGVSTAEFDALVSNLGDGGSTNVNWQVNIGSGYTDIDSTTHNGVYEDYSTQNLSIVSTIGLNGHLYRMKSETNVCMVYTEEAKLTINPAS